jgi:fibrillarin-like rRNA methylase
MRKTSNRPSSYKTRTYIQKAVIANRRLRNGDITRIAESTGYSTTHVSDVVSGKEFNERIMNRMFDMVRGRKANAELI